MLRGYCYVMAAATLWGLIGPVSKLAMAQGMEPLEVGFWRIVLGWALFATHALATGKAVIARRDLPPVLAFGVVGVAGLFGSYVLAVHEGGAALAAVLLYTAPAWVALLSWLFLKEHMNAATLIAVAMTILGAAGVSAGRGFTASGRPFFAILFGLLSGVTYALYYIFGKRFLCRYTTPTLFLYAMPVGALTLYPFFSFAPFSATAYAACGVVALCSTYGAYSIYYAGLKRLPASRAAVVATVEPLVAGILAYAWYGEAFTFWGYCGSALILGAVLVMIGGERRAASRGEKP